MEYILKINEFEGPLDLLLHLIKKMEIDIWDISITDVTKSYLEYIKKMEELNLDVASEYLEMAAELIELKSRLLLPKEKIAEDSEYEEDPKEALIRKLIEYKKYKESINKFKELEEERNTFITKTSNDTNKYRDNNPWEIKEEVGVAELLKAFENFLQRKEYEKPITTKVTTKELTINERRISIKKTLKEKKEIKFEELFDILEKSYIITTFLAILEMTKAKEIILKQDRNLSDILISLKEGGKIE